ncbi:hypothetical protein BU25DRAFT_211108 [Macroventuria anomochaeta]|uniref:Uncharacterized protein n=1 Tax=Macroventuria anomochaeta TaxID=301207 RepID=A0ACB6RMF1_9PLEO|nr:uncharacterized protein BU25DRAFT_211108 [Macroventuria anomochaeta]KAF2622334.1 hypothetical protein BU25DRAFT_211108 [Macroventuria anomochaeta]
MHIVWWLRKHWDKSIEAKLRIVMSVQRFCHTAFALSYSIVVPCSIAIPCPIAISCSVVISPRHRHVSHTEPSVSTALSLLFLCSPACRPCSLA